jgi:hypothetical protein
MALDCMAAICASGISEPKWMSKTEPESGWFSPMVFAQSGV